MKTLLDSELQILVQFLKVFLQKVFKYVNQEVVGKIFWVTQHPRFLGLEVRPKAQSPKKYD